MTEICALFSSPRDAGIGLSSTLHEEYLKDRVERVSRFYPARMHLEPCKACNACKTGKACIIDDDMYLLYDTLVSASLISVSYPLYFSGLPSTLKTVIDRCHALWNHKRTESLSLPPNRKAILFVTAGSSYSGMFRPSLTVMKHFLNTISVVIDFEQSHFICNTDESPQKVSVYPDLTDTIGGKY